MKISCLELEETKLSQSYWFNSSYKTQRVILKTRANTPGAVEQKLQKLKYTEFPESIIVMIYHTPSRLFIESS